MASSDVSLGPVVRASPLWFRATIVALLLAGVTAAFFALLRDPPSTTHVSKRRVSGLVSQALGQHNRSMLADHRTLQMMYAVKAQQLLQAARDVSGDDAALTRHSHVDVGSWSQRLREREERLIFTDEEE